LSESRQSLSTGWIGIVKNPSFMVCSSPKAAFYLAQNVLRSLLENKLNYSPDNLTFAVPSRLIPRKCR
jgi:hypothetical protein